MSHHNHVGWMVALSFITSHLFGTGKGVILQDGQIFGNVFAWQDIFSGVWIIHMIWYQCIELMKASHGILDTCWTLVGRFDANAKLIAAAANFNVAKTFSIQVAKLTAAAASSDVAQTFCLEFPKWQQLRPTPTLLWRFHLQKQNWQQRRRTPTLLWRFQLNAETDSGWVPTSFWRFLLNAKLIAQRRWAQMLLWRFHMNAKTDN